MSVPDRNRLPGYVIPPHPGAAGVLTNDGQGNLSWQPGGGLPTPFPRDQILKTTDTGTPTPVWTNELFLGNF